MTRTKKKTGMSMLLAAALLATPIAISWTTAPARAEEKKQKTELHKKMEVMDENLKKLKRTVKKPEQNAESLKLVAEVQEAAVASKDLTPSKAVAMPEADRKKFVAEYKKGMEKVVDTLEQMKKALAANDNEKAQELYKSLKQQEEDGHDQFMESDDKDAGKGDKAGKAEKSEK